MGTWKHGDRQTATYAKSLLRHLRYSLGEPAARWKLSDFQRELRIECARRHAAPTCVWDLGVSTAVDCSR